MRFARLIGIGILTMAASALPFSSASARYCQYHYCGYHEGPVLDVADAAGAVVTGALVIATAPVALAADIVSAPLHTTEAYDYGPYYGGEAYYAGPRYYIPRHHWRRYYRPAYCCSYGY
ncbi:MAG TPA: hypothetical protein VLC74_01870 [Rhizomicrobium sp.]|nr:hypothetical protein [Rhizomicrobium sp.]